MFLVTGATGPLGSAVVDQLLTRVDASEVAVLVRDESRAVALASKGVRVCIGDYDDVAALDRAFAGVDRVLLVPGTDAERRVQQHQNVIDASVRTGVSVFGFASRTLRDIQASGNTLMADYFETEDRIRASGLRHVLFRNALYLDTVPLYVGGPAVFETGSIAIPAGSGAVAYVLRQELGEAAANGLLDHEGEDRTHVLAAPRAWTFDDVAIALSTISDTPVTYTPVSDDEYVASTVRRGVPEHMARRFLGFFYDIRDGQLDQTGTDLATLLRREPATFEAGLREVFGR